jgi:DNA modification methylase
MNKVFFGDCRDTMRQLSSDGVKVQMCVTSPPYFGLRDYGHPGQIGLEKTPDEFVVAMVEVFALVWDLLADDGTAENLMENRS